jgi:hypothetical protein
MFAKKRSQRLSKIYKFSQSSGLCDCRVIRNPSAFDEDAFDEDYYSDEEEPFPSIESLFEGSGIRMMFKDQPYSACVTDEGRVVGALVAHQDGYWEWGEEPVPIYYFSRVVSPTCRNAGIAKKLLSDFMSSNRGSIIKSETYNRVLDHSLISSGFREEWEESGAKGSVKLHTFVPEHMREDYFSSKNDDALDQKKLAKVRLLNILSKIS